jgi:hypothetical protein
MGKYWKNLARDKKPKVAPYVPQWQLLGTEPVPVDFGNPNNPQQLTRHAPFIAHTAPRNKRETIHSVSANVPFAEVVPTANRHTATLPNVGNNIENTWAAFDDAMNESGNFAEGVDPNHPMIDNNDFVEDQSNSQEEYIMVEDASQLNVEYNEYVLMVNGEIISTGALDPIQEEVRALVFGEHPLTQNQAVDPDNIVVLKRIKIKVGVFLE